MVKLIFILSTFLPFLAHTKEKKLCNDLYDFSCTPGDYDDGTGIGRNQTLVKNDALKMIMEVNDDLFSNFKEALGNPDNGYFLKLALSNSKLSNSPYCKPKDGRYSEKCINDAALGITDFAARELGGNPDPGMSCPTCGALGGKMELSDSLLLTSNSVYREIKAKALSKVRTLVNDDEQKNKIRDKVFPNIKSKIIAKIKSHVKDPELRQLLIDKMTALTFEDAACGGDEQSQNLPQLLKANISYNPVTNRFMVCNGLLLSNKSEFHMAFVVAHELTHAIGPCGITVGPEAFRFEYKEDSTLLEAEEQYPFEKILGCLRNKRSAGAQRNKTMAVPKYGYSYGETGRDAKIPGGAGYYYGVPQNPEAMNPVDKFTGFCGKADQIDESFSDWLAVEVLPEYIEESLQNLTVEQREIGYSNVFRGACQSTPNSFAFDEHPATAIRVNNILAVHPKVREQMGCKGAHPKNLHCVPGVDVDLENKMDTPQLPPKKGAK